MRVTVTAGSRGQVYLSPTLLRLRTASPWRRYRLAHRRYSVAQPSVRRVGVRSGMPHRRNRDRRRRNGKVEADKALRGRVNACWAGETGTWHKRHQVRVARDAHRIRETGHDGDDLSFEPKRLQCVVDWPGEFPFARRHDMTARRVAFGRHLPSQQRMSDPDRTDEGVAEQEPGPHLRRGRSEHPNLKVNVSIPEWKSILVWLGREAQSDMGRDVGDRGDQGGAEKGYEPLRRREW